MIDDKKIGDFVSASMDAMHKCPEAADVESVKKIINRKVGFFERKNLLAYLVYSASVKERTGAVHQVQKSQNRQNAKQFARLSAKPSADKSEARNEDVSSMDSVSDENVPAVSGSHAPGSSSRVALWCSIFCKNPSDVEDLLSFIASESGISRESVSDYRQCGRYSFMYASDSESAAKIVGRFSSSVLFKDTLKVVVRYKGVKNAK